MVSGGEMLVRALKAQQVDRIFCVAGESYLPVLDALLDYPEIEVVTCRHESGATFSAEAHAQMTGRPAVAMVTRGPGACNGSIGIHAAKQSSAPVILFVGLIATHDRDKEAFQEFDLPQMFGSLSKWAANIDQAQRVDDYVNRAFHLSLSGRPGPVVLGLPEEVLLEDSGQEKVKPPVPRSLIAPAPDDFKRLKDVLESAERPFVIIGGDWDDETCKRFEQVSGDYGLPVAASLRRQDLFNHRHSSYAGELGFGPNPKMIAAIKRADVVLALGGRLDEITLQAYGLIEEGQTLLHVYPEASEFGKSCHPDVVLQSHVTPFVEAMVEQGLGGDNERRKGWCASVRNDYEQWTVIEKLENPGWEGADMNEIFRQLQDLLPEDAIITTDAGNFSGWCQRYLRYGRPGRLLAPVSGAMGYAVPSVVAASMQYPERLSVGFCGDGGFMMTGQEIATAVHHDAKPIIIVCNNGMYGTIRMHQERDFPGRVSATALSNPDFALLAQSYGAFGAAINDAADFKEVWEKALAANRPALIEIRMDPRQITTNAKP